MASDFLEIVRPHKTVVPVLISIPHSGTAFPSETLSFFKSEAINQPQDCDWFVDKLYSFAPQLGITIIKNSLCRYVIDFNRDPHSRPLYNDGRLEIGLFPDKTFLGKPILVKPLDEGEQQRRLKNYYWPYYQILSEELERLKLKFGHAILLDAHSIRSRVATIRPDPFPQLILGDQEGRTADLNIVAKVKTLFEKSDFDFSYNHPFKGGHLTRYFGKPESHIHALQLEMCQNIYMSEETIEYLPEKAKKIQEVLKAFLNILINFQEKA